MSDVRIIRVKSKLARFAFGKGGVAFQDAVKRADEAVAANFGAFLVTVDEILAELQAGFGQAGPDRTATDYEAVYGLASRLIDVSICLPETLLANAAHALCELADRGAETGRWDQQAVEIHIKVLQLLRHAGSSMSAAQRTRVVEGLGKVTERRLGENPEPAA